jgi:outer membrane protein OmpA-like peptidoglycan-associated protein
MLTKNTITLPWVVSEEDAMKTSLGRHGALGVLLLVGVIGITSGCATRRYARDRVAESAQELTAQMEQKDQQLQQGIESNTNQISELSAVTRDHTQDINTLETGLKTTDDKAGQALNVGQSAQSAANQATTQISTLDQKFQNRNLYTAIAEEKVAFKFNSATLDKETLPTLDQVAQQVKSNPDAIIVLEGRTDNAGDETYNIQLGDRRLDAVVRYLVVEQGVPMHRVHKMSYGEAQPVAPNNTREGRAENRSVVIKVMGPEGGSGRMVSGSL